MDPRLVDEFRRICGDAAVLRDAVQLMTYECDALPQLRQMPAIVVLPGSAAEVQAIVRACSRASVPFVARGHGRGLSRGALPVPGGVVVWLARVHRRLNVETPNGRATVHPGGSR